MGETMSFDLETLDIEGYNGKRIMNKFLKQKSGSGPLSVVLPGLRYNVDMPILYYTTGILLAAGHSVLSVDIRYSEIQEFMSGSSQERTKWMFKDAETIYNTIQSLEGHNLSVLAGKSLGTILMSYMVQNNQDIQECKTLWLTPLLHHDLVVNQMIAHKGKLVPDEPRYKPRGSISPDPERIMAPMGWRKGQPSPNFHYENKTIGWMRTCTCRESEIDEIRSKPCIVLDPFAGSGTVSRVAEKLGRKHVALDLAYQDHQKKRMREVQREMYS